MSCPLLFFLMFHHGISSKIKVFNENSFQQRDCIRLVSKQCKRAFIADPFLRFRPYCMPKLVKCKAKIVFKFCRVDEVGALTLFYNPLRKNPSECMVTMFISQTFLPP